MRTINMDDIEAFFKKTWRAFGILLCIFSNMTHAEDYTEFETTVYRLSSDYRAYVFFNGDPKYNRSLTSMINQSKRFNDLLNQQPSLLNHWQKIVSQIQLVLNDESNIRNVNVQAHWELMLGDLNRELASVLKSRTPENTSTDTRSKSYNRLLMLRMERVLALYMSLTNPVGGLGISAEAPDIEDKVKEITSMLSKSELKDSDLKNVYKKWSFVKKTLLKYNTDATPFIVLHSYKKIRTELQDYINLPN